jgi:Fe-S cluster assembly protein SufD
LKIDTNDVASAGHAATSGQVDDEMLFYMQSRGIDKSEAVRMIVMGVFAPALNAIPLEELRESLMVAIEGKI